jgi:isopentenyldiphosphate isomerase
MNKLKVIIVNESDEIIGYKFREEILNSDIYRVSGLWITNSKGQILLAQRSFSKTKNPGEWGPAVAGTIEEGETYDSNIYKEAQEEIGLENYSFEKSFKLRISNDYNYFAQWYVATVDKEISEFTKQDEEVEEIRWFEPEDLIEDIKQNPNKFLTNLLQYVEMFND